MSGLLFDDDDAEEIPDASLAWSRKLVVAPACEKPDELNRLEEQYRQNGCPPVLFDDGDGIWNVGTFAAAMSADPATLTLEAAEVWLTNQRR
jgi:hypothetical protein